ncbi:MAG TPA: histidine phosphatase family protein [Anaerolineales bacterium]|nr:histidine phosphatase family protein [Anaerolineales bacterium]
MTPEHRTPPGEIHLTLMRHGRSRADDEGVHEGRYDSPLTEVGRAQVHERGQGWQAAHLQIDHIIASPLVRAKESAQIIGGLLLAPVSTDADWMETNNGPLAGLSHEEAAKRYPLPAFRNPYEPICGSGESEWELHSRAGRALEAVVRRGPGHYLVVAHGGILNAALRCLVGAPPPINFSGVWFHLGDTGYAHTLYRPHKHQWVIRQFEPGIG